MPERRPNSVAPVRVGPLRPLAVLAIELDCTDWLDGEAIIEVDIAAASPIAVGDAVAAVASAAGNVTPPAPTFNGAIVTGYLYASGAVTDGDDYTATVTIRTTTRADLIEVVFAAHA